MLTSAVMPLMCVYRGQYGTSGHVINLPQDVLSFSTSLPQLPSELDIVVVKKYGTHQSHHEFHVRRSVVQNFLQWLRINNGYYRANQVHINQGALAQLPQDGNSPVSSVTVNVISEHCDPIQKNVVKSWRKSAFHTLDVQHVRQR